FSKDDWTDISNHIEICSKDLNEDVEKKTQLFEEYQKRVQELTKELSEKFWYFRDEEAFGEYPNDIVEKLEKELKKHQKREQEILEEGIEKAYNYFKYMLQDVTETRLKYYISPETEDIKQD
ncbi:MAG: hypothetical protein J6K42_08325, partial [Clostridia bacterium]|nr:hypothetical protein [Clostridia bacterium]